MVYSTYPSIFLMLMTLIQQFDLSSPIKSETSNNLIPIRQLLLEEYYGKNNNLSLHSSRTGGPRTQNPWSFYENWRKQRKRDLMETDMRPSTTVVSSSTEETKDTNWLSTTTTTTPITYDQTQNQDITTEISSTSFTEPKKDSQYSINNSDQKIDKSTQMPPEKSSLVQNVLLRDPCNNLTMLCFGDFVECRNGYCKCIDGYVPRSDNRDICGERTYYNVEIPQTDPTMIGVVIGLALMSVTLCVVLRLFAKARFRENRTIFNTPNPRLMNVSLMKGHRNLFRANSNTAESKTRRDSQVSVSSTATDKKGSRPSALANASRPKPIRQLSTDTTTTFGGTPDSPSAMKLPPGVERLNRNKYGSFRQDSVTSNSVL